MNLELVLIGSAAGQQTKRLERESRVVSHPSLQRKLCPQRSMNRNRRNPETAHRDTSTRSNMSRPLPDHGVGPHSDEREVCPHILRLLYAATAAPSRSHPPAPLL